MEKYKGKAKCCCGNRAKYRAGNGSSRVFACEEHKKKLNNVEEVSYEIDKLTEADYQTWLRL